MLHYFLKLLRKKKFTFLYLSVWLIVSWNVKTQFNFVIFNDFYENINDTSTEREADVIALVCPHREETKN